MAKKPAPATESQLRTLAAHNLWNGEDISKKDASALISKVKELGQTPHWELADSLMMKIYKLRKKKAKAEFSELEKTLSQFPEGSADALNTLKDIEGVKVELEDIQETLSDGYTDKDRISVRNKKIRVLKARGEKEGFSEEIKAQISELEEEVDEIKSDIKEEKYEIKELKEMFESSKDFNGFTKKPTIAEMKATVDALDAWNKHWKEDKKAWEYVRGILTTNFSHLTSKQSRPSSGTGKAKGKAKQSSNAGCLLIGIILFFALWYFFIR